MKEIHKNHLEYIYCCPNCGEKCDDHTFVTECSPKRYIGEGIDWTETIQCTCGEIWEVETGI